MIWNWIVDSIPWWVYLVGFIMGLGIVTYIFGPILLPLWNRLPGWLKWTLSAIGVGFLVWIAGRNQGRSNARAEQREREHRAVQSRVEINQRVDKQSEAEIRRDAKRFYRD